VQLRRLAGVAATTPRAGYASARSVLFVCHGNIMRSPMAEALLKRRLASSNAGVSICSAGLHAEGGRPADARVQVVARSYGVSLEHHRAERVTDAHIGRADLILLMDVLNEAELLGRYPHARPKTLRLGSWLGDGRRDREIFDPYDGDDTDIHRCCELIQSAVDNLAAEFRA
jgi:protein-tyrosine phosphatase